MTLYTRKNEEKAPELNDFLIRSVIGKGSFGKVRLAGKNKINK